MLRSVLVWFFPLARWRSPEDDGGWGEVLAYVHASTRFILSAARALEVPLANGHPPVALHHGGAVFYSVDNPPPRSTAQRNRRTVNWRSRTRLVKGLLTLANLMYVAFSGVLTTQAVKPEAHCPMRAFRLLNSFAQPTVRSSSCAFRQPKIRPPPGWTFRQSR